MEKISGMMFGKPIFIEADRETCIRFLKVIGASFDWDTKISEKNTIKLTEEEEMAIRI